MNMVRPSSPTIAFVTACIGPKHIENVQLLFKSIQEFYPIADLYLFTDQALFYPDHVKIISVHFVPNPLPALLRYHYIMSFQTELIRYDHIFWIDADSEIMASFEHEAFSDIVVASHPWFDMVDGPFEKNQNSTAFVRTPDPSVRYVQGNFQGGKALQFLSLCEILRQNTDTDLMARIIPVWYDESHLNWYVQNYPVTQLHPGYAYPSSMPIPYPKIISHYNAHDRVKGFD